VELELADKVAVLTGGASGIGAATARALHAEGVQLTVIDRDADALDQIAGQLPGIGTEQADVAIASDVERAHAAVIERHGRLDVAVNNAGITRPVHWLHDFPLQEWNDVIGVNLTGVFLCMRAQLAIMQGQAGGVIVNTASAAGLVGAPGTAPYTAAKHAVIGLTRTAALEYAPLGVRINAVAPGTIDTPLSGEFSARNAVDDPFADALVRQGHPLKPLGTAAEVADAILFLASDRSSFATGSTLVLDGGLTAQ
jgi:NAD(P)-dependent dehydrogenase (short-subunit alcohol dehydrogenase family)